MRMDLVATTKTLPSIFTEIVDVLCSSSVGQALNFYQDFVSYAHTEEGVRNNVVSLFKGVSTKLNYLQLTKT